MFNDDSINGPSIPLHQDEFSKALSPADRGQYATPIAKQKPGGAKGCDGVIQKVNKETHSYDVTIVGAEAPLSAVPRLMQSMGDLRMLPVGARVAVSYDYGRPVIMGILPYTVGRTDNRTDISITGETSTGGGASNLESPTSGGNYRPPNMPNDVGPGDEGIIGPDGNVIAALAGGVNIIKSGMAEVRTHVLNDLLELLCRNYRLTSDMGISEIKNDNGRVSWSFRGGADQLTEAGSDQENWTIRMDLGAVGDLFNFALSKPDGGTLFKLHVNSDGKFDVFAAEDIDEFVGANKITKVLGNRVTEVKQDDTQTIKGSQNKAIQGNRDTSISNSDTQTVGNDHTLSVVRNKTDSVGGQHKETAVGGKETTLVNGGWDISIGDPINGATPAALAGFNLNTFTGDILGKVKLKGDIDFETLLGNVGMFSTAGQAVLKTSLGQANLDGTTVHLGSLGASAANPLVKGAVFASGLGAFTGTNGSAAGILAGATSVLVAANGPVWNLTLSTAFGAWLAAVSTYLTTLSASNNALATAVQTMLSTKIFTA